MKKASFAEKLKYRFDSMMSRGPLAVIVWLAVATLLLVIIAAAFIAAFGILPEDAEHMSFIEAFWQSLMRTLDAGTMGGDSGWGFRAVMLIVTIGGIFIVSALIGIISAGFDQKLEELRKGRSKVLESGHTLILGWSPKIFTILGELTIANQNQHRPHIVILSEVEKSEMEDQIKSLVPQTFNAKIITRSGDPLENADLEMVNYNKARSIIILPPEKEEMHDLFIIKVALAIINNPGRKKEKFNIVAEIRDEKTLEVLDLIGRDEISVLQLSEVMARLTVQVAHQPGLSVVIEDLLRFDGDEIYFSHIPNLNGKQFRDIQLMFEDSTIIGVQKKSGETKLNPPMNYILAAEDKIIAISEDDDTIAVNGHPEKAVREEKATIVAEKTHKPVHTTILGYSPRMKMIIHELANYFPEGSTLNIYVQKNYKSKAEELKTEHLKINIHNGDITSRKFLENLNLMNTDYVMILSEPDLSIQQADANTLVSLLLVRDIIQKNNYNTNIVSEMLDPQNSDLARISRKNDFIVSDKLVSLLISMISENKDLKPVIDDLLDADGSEIYFKPITDYVIPGKNHNFYQISAAASDRGQVAFGYRIMTQSNNPEKAYGIVMNPKKSNAIVFNEEDMLIVLAED
ncbi:MAG TPA: NAD-binding protein [Bacteroidales bacterium]|nr:NAD-binding protein [Bacteroidales bacterium]